jgi:hypothetical protein
MPHGGARPGAGRKPGQLTKRSLEAIEHLGPVGQRALGVLATAMEDPKVPWSCRIQAAGMIADRAYGRTPQSVSLDVTRELNDLSLAELLPLEAKLVAEQRMIDVTPAESVGPSDGSQR